MAQIIETGKKEIERVPAKVFLEYRNCTCGGRMIYQESFVRPATWPAQFTHKCNSCGKVESYMDKYPKTVMEEDAHDPLKPILD